MIRNPATRPTNPQTGLVGRAPLAAIFLGTKAKTQARGPAPPNPVLQREQ
jgi:hypothetical protein